MGFQIPRRQQRQRRRWLLLLPLLPLCFHDDEHDCHHAIPATATNHHHERRPLANSARWPLPGVACDWAKPLILQAGFPPTHRIRGTSCASRVFGFQASSSRRTSCAEVALFGTCSDLSLTRKGRLFPHSVRGNISTPNMVLRSRTGFQTLEGLPP